MKRTVAMVALAACVAPPSFSQTQASPIVMTVNDQPVHYWEMRLVAPQVQADMAERGIERSREAVFALAAKKVVDTKLLAQEARRKNINPSADSIDVAMKQIESMAGGSRGLDATLNNLGATYDDLRANVFQSEAVKLYIATQIEPQVAVTPQEISAYYDNNPDVFMQPEMVRARHILFRVPPKPPAAAKRTARSKAEAAHRRVKGGEDFAAVAREVSEGSEAPRGGDLGYFTRDEMVPVLANAAFALDVGKISGIIESQFGFHIVQIEDKKAAGKMPFAEAKIQAEQLLREDKIGELLGPVIEELRQSATIVQVVEQAEEPSGQ